MLLTLNVSQERAGITTSLVSAIPKSAAREWTAQKTNGKQILQNKIRAASQGETNEVWFALAATQAIE